MIFKSIKLINFRQYKGENEYKFSNPDESKITLFIAENGVGKTTLIQAFRFCFYGTLQNNKYLNLPMADDLLNNKIVDELKDGDRCSLSVEISFIHNAKDYIMKREIEYMKQNGKIIRISENNLATLGEREDGIGFKFIKDDLANLEMAQILPPGLSHIFMFDGERMERAVSSPEFKEDLKESILGILDIKKFDSLIYYLGTEHKVSTVIGKLQAKITHSSIEERTEKRKYDLLLGKIESEETEIKRLEKDIESIEIKLQQFRSSQKERTSDLKNVTRAETLELEINYLKEQEKAKSKELVQKGLRAILSKQLMKTKDPFDEFINKTVEDEEFYQYLHEETLRQILYRKRCICGSSVLPNSIEEEAINNMFKNALPMANAQYLSYIRSDIFGNISSYPEQIRAIKKLKEEINLIKVAIQKYLSEMKMLSKEIIKNEKKDGHSTQEEYEELVKKKEDMITEKATNETNLETTKRLFRIQENIMKPMWEVNESNKVILRAVDTLKKIREILIQLRDEKDSNARMVLSSHFNSEIKEVMSGNYETKINKDYSIKIFDKDKQKDVTEILSTGQSVVISVSFIKSLILTAQELSKEYSRENQYGVIMDAALSNLDENHIMKISSSNLNQLDQLIFLSFRRQLRDEMYLSIKDNIGKSYVLSQGEEGIESQLLMKEELDEYIHRKVEVEYGY